MFCYSFGYQLSRNHSPPVAQFIILAPCKLKLVVHINVPKTPPWVPLKNLILYDIGCLICCVINYDIQSDSNLRFD